MLLFAASMSSLKKLAAPFTPDTSQVHATQPMAPLEVASLSTLPALVPSSQTHPSPISLSTLPSPSLNLKITQYEQEQIAHHSNQSAHLSKLTEKPASSVTESTEAPNVSNNRSPTQVNDRWDTPLPTRKPTGTINKYPHNLTPNPSSLRPMCAAADQLHLWKPLQASIDNSTTPFASVEDSERTKNLMSNTWQETTRVTYATGLLTFHIFCDQKSVNKTARAPASTELIITFISAMAGSLAGSTINNYINGIRTWHIIHRIAWSVDHLAIETALHAATVSAPSASSKPPRQPVTVDYLAAILSHLSKDNPLNAAVAACMTTTFWSVSRLGEFTVETISRFNCKKNITAKDTGLSQDRNGLQVRFFNLPFTKCAKGKGESMSWARQLGPVDPWQAFENHHYVNMPPLDAHLFAYKVSRRKTLTPLTKRKLLEQVKSIMAKYNLPNFEGHGLRIRGTLEYLLRGVPFEVVQSMGRWKSDTFQRYLHEHAQILAPYLQATPALNLEFVHISMPPPQ